jgi:NRPS condensation-like uncharacterized protein
MNAERAMLMPPFNVVMAARLSTTLDSEEIRRAAERLRTRHALLAVRVQLDADGEARYCSDGVPELHVREVVAQSDDDLENQWLDEVMRECRTSFPLETGPLVRFVVVRGTAMTYLLVSAHHVISDGKSLTFLLRDVLEAVGNPTAEPARLPPPPPIDETTVAEPPRTPWIARLILKLMSRKWRKKGLRFDLDDRDSLQQAFWDKHTGATAIAWQLSPEQTAALATACRAEGVTVNSALWTAFLLAQREVQGDVPPHRRQAGMAVSTRDRLKVEVGEALGFYASSLNLELTVDSRASFWDAARQVQTRIGEALGKTQIFRMLAANALPSSLMDSLYFAKYGLIDDAMSTRMLKRLKWDRVSFGYSITNVGRGNIPTRYGAHRLDAVYGPFFYSDVNEKVVGVTTVGDVLTFSLTCNESAIGRDVAPRIREASLAHLEHACSARP